MYERKAVSKNLTLLIKKLFTTKNYFYDLYLQNFFSKGFIQYKWRILSN